MVARRTLKRIRRILAGAFYCALIGGVGHLAVTRWNGVPADTSTNSGGSRIPPPPVDPAFDRTAQYNTALAAIPPSPIVNLPPAPAGMKWNQPNCGSRNVEFGDVASGAWTPKTRPNLQTAIDYCNTPAVDDALRQLADIQLGACRRDAVSMSSIRRAIKLLSARARYRHAAQGDIDDAVADIRTLFRLALIGYNSADSLHHFVALASEEMAYLELCAMAHERNLTREQVAMVHDAIRMNTLESNKRFALLKTAAFEELEHFLNLAYTDDGAGNGWLVLSHLTSASDAVPAPRTRCGLWNALSVFYNDRQTIKAKLKRTENALDRAAQAASYDEAKEIMAEVEDSQRVFNLLDGPLGYVGGRNTAVSFFNYNIRKTALRRGTIVALALSAYRSDHGRYPSSQELLLDGYLDSLPLDPYTNAPLRYIPTDDGKDYKLYSVGSNQIDNAGERVYGPQQGKSADAPDDQLIRHTRTETYWEPKLEPIKP